EQLADKVHADFTVVDNYDAELERLARTIGLFPPLAEGVDEAKLDALLRDATTHAPMLRAAVDEMRALGSLSYSTIEAIMVGDTPPHQIEYVLLLMAGRFGAAPYAQLAICIAAIHLADATGTGYRVLEHCLRDSRMDEDQRSSVGIALTNVKSTEAVLR